MGLVARWFREATVADLANVASVLVEHGLPVERVSVRPPRSPRDEQPAGP
jgi:hypothetical protein